MSPFLFFFRPFGQMLRPMIDSMTVTPDGGQQMFPSAQLSLNGTSSNTASSSQTNAAKNKVATEFASYPVTLVSIHRYIVSLFTPLSFFLSSLTYSKT